MTDASDAPAPSFLVRYRRLVVLAWAVYWIALTVLLLSPKVPRAPITISQKGLVVHFCTFAILAYLCVLSRRATTAPLSAAWAFRWWAIFAAYGGATELLQPLSNRHCDFEDFAVDAIGAGLVLFVVTLSHRNRDRQRKA